jgi:hypothetical protein
MWHVIIGISAMLRRPGIACITDGMAFSVIAQVAISPLIPPSILEIIPGSPEILISS